MTQPLKILGIPGSLRKQSYNHGALRAAQPWRGHRPDRIAPAVE